MMRGTYFRAWDTYNQAWADEYLAITEDGYVVEIKNDGTTEYWKDRFIIEFGTGLKDKNGKEICDGDIIDFFGEKYPVIYRAGGFWAEYSKTQKDHLFLYAIDSEVIGNIHDNPELLKEEK